jgi:hypothetical protein|tara:strand:- start:1106 stop:1867 length:762 start_codon:yes stop_codon:yes gene_type:complete
MSDYQTEDVATVKQAEVAALNYPNGPEDSGLRSTDDLQTLNNMTELTEEKKHKNISLKTINRLGYNLKARKFQRLKKCVIDKVNNELIQSLKTECGDTQVKERLSINFIKGCLDELKYTYEEAGSQQSKDFRNINNIGFNIEVKKTDGLTVYFNDTLPNTDIFYIIIFTGKVYKTKEDIPPKLIFINGYDLCKPDIYHLFEYKKEIEDMKDRWGRKKTKKKANNFKHFSVYPRPTFKTDISYLFDSDYSCSLD